jgi:type II secretory pathway pseudopilin PulG
VADYRQIRERVTKPACVSRYGFKRRFSLAFVAESGAIFAPPVDEREMKLDQLPRSVHGTRPGSRSRRLGRRGVTLAEAVVVLTLIGLLAGFSIPRFLEPTPASIVTDEAELLAWTMRLARYRAITLSQPVYIELESNGTANSYTAYISATDPPAPTADGVAKTRIPFPDIVGGMSGRALPPRLAFESASNGIAPPATAAVNLMDGRLGFDSRGGAFWPDASETGVGLVIARHQVSEDVRAVTVTRRGEVRVWRLTQGGWR